MKAYASSSVAKTPRTVLSGDSSCWTIQTSPPPKGFERRKKRGPGIRLLTMESVCTDRMSDALRRPTTDSAGRPGVRSREVLPRDRGTQRAAQPAELPGRVRRRLGVQHRESDGLRPVHREPLPVEADRPDLGVVQQDGATVLPLHVVPVPEGPELITHDLELLGEVLRAPLVDAGSGPPQVADEALRDRIVTWEERPIAQSGVAEPGRRGSRRGWKSRSAPERSPRAGT